MKTIAAIFMCMTALALELPGQSIRPDARGPLASDRQYVAQATKSAPDGDADLAYLTVSPGRLSPTFSPRTILYTISVPADAAGVSLTAGASSPNALISIADGLQGRTGRPLRATFHLLPGTQREVTIVVTAQNGSQKQYRLSMSRPGAAVASSTPPQKTEPPNSTPVAPTKARPAPNRTPSTPNRPATSATRPAAPESDAPQPSTSTQPQRPAPRPGTTAPTRPTREAPERAAQATEQTPQAAARPETPVAALPTPPAIAPEPMATRPQVGSTRITIEAKNLRLEEREAEAVTEGGGSIGQEASVTVRYYRSDQILHEQSVRVSSRKQGRTYSLSFDYESPNLSVETDRLIEVEVGIPALDGYYLHYTEARRFNTEIEMEPPFLLLGQTARVSWPEIGIARPVVGYVSLLPPGQDRGTRPADSENFESNSRNEYGIDVTLGDPTTGATFGTEAVWTKPGLSRGHAFPFGTAIMVPEGDRFSYLMTARARNGRLWSSEGISTAWTTMLAYDGGFEPILLVLDDELTTE